MELLLRAGEPHIADGTIDLPGFQVRAEHAQPRSWSRAFSMSLTRGAKAKAVCSPCSPSRTSEREPVASAFTAGRPDAMASSVTLPKVSVMDGKKKMSLEA